MKAYRSTLRATKLLKYKFIWSLNVIQKINSLLASNMTYLRLKEVHEKKMKNEADSQSREELAAQIKELELKEQLILQKEKADKELAAERKRLADYRSEVIEKEEERIESQGVLEASINLARAIDKGTGEVVSSVVGLLATGIGKLRFW